MMARMATMMMWWCRCDNSLMMTVTMMMKMMMIMMIVMMMSHLLCLLVRVDCCYCHNGKYCDDDDDNDYDYDDNDDGWDEWCLSRLRSRILQLIILQTIHGTITQYVYNTFIGACHMYHFHKVQCGAVIKWPIMMTSSNGDIFRVTGHLCGEFTGDRWIPLTKASDGELWYFRWSAPWISG